jgi:hypothetical protein
MVVFTKIIKHFKCYNFANIKIMFFLRPLLTLQLPILSAPRTEFLLLPAFLLLTALLYLAVPLLVASLYALMPMSTQLRTPTFDSIVSCVLAVPCVLALADIPTITCGSPAQGSLVPAMPGVLLLHASLLLLVYLLLLVSLLILAFLL